MTVLNKSETDKINEVVDYILTHYNTSVGAVKRKFNLTKDEYEMISELMMPALRYFNEAKRLEMGINAVKNKYKIEEERFNARRLAVSGGRAV